MLACPHNHNPDLVKILKLRRKFNETLEKALVNEDFMHTIHLSSVSGAAFFNTAGGLTKSGQIQFWAEINHHMKGFDYKEDKLFLQKFKSSKTSTKSLCSKSFSASDRLDRTSSRHENDRYH